MYERNYQAKVLKTDEKKSQKKKSFPWKRAVIIASVVIGIVGIVLLIRSPRFQVKTINVVGANVADPIDVSQFVLNNLEGKFAWILPKSSIFLVSTESVTHAVSTQFPRFKSVTVDRDGMSSLRVSVVEYPGMYLWCDSPETCSFMDETGTVFADAPYFSGSAYPRIIIGTRAPYPFHPISPEQVQLVAHLTDHLKGIEITPLSFTFESDRKLSVIFIHHTAHATLYLDPTEDVDEALETLYTGLRTKPIIDMYRDASKVLEYFDLRFANKLIYKFN